MSDLPGAYREISRRDLASRTAITALGGVVAGTLLETSSSARLGAQTISRFHAVAGVDRAVFLPGKTYLRGWAGEGDPPSSTVPRNRGYRPEEQTAAAADATAKWSKRSGPGSVQFSDPNAFECTARFSAPGRYVLELQAERGPHRETSTLEVVVEPQLPRHAYEEVPTSSLKIEGPLWKRRLRAIAVNWIPHCIRQINRTDIEIGPGGIDNFVEAGKALSGEPHGLHKGYVFSNAWVYQTVESMSLALQMDAEGDAELAAAHTIMRETLADWIPKILAAQEADGYLQTAYTLNRSGRDGKIVESSKFAHWDPSHRGDHEGYVAGYLLEAAISHHRMTRGKDARLFNAARKLADCWCANLGPPPKKPWFDGHQGMEQALFRFARYIDDLESAGAGSKYRVLGKYLLDARYHAADGPRGRHEYDQSHLPVVEQYEAVGHAVRAVYTYSAMADVAIEFGDPDYRSAARSVWGNIVHRKYYVTGGVGSGETSEGFGPDYSLRNRAYCESCSSCGEVFFQWKMARVTHDARCADLYEETLYNALLGSMDLEARNFYYDNPLDARVARYQWHVCPCCVGNVPRTLLMLPTWIYMKSSDRVVVNLFVGSTVTVEGVAGTSVEMVQKTDYPWSGRVSITVNPAEPKLFAVLVRMPNRAVSDIYANAPSADGIKSISINGVRTDVAETENGYAVISRVWKAGDRIDLELPLTPQRVRAIGKVEATRGKVALRYGPLVYNLEQRDQDIAKADSAERALSAKTPLRAEWNADLLGGVVALRGEFADGSPLLAIPNFARMNREQGLAYPPAPQPRNPDGSRPEAPSPKSIVWIREA